MSDYYVNYNKIGQNIGHNSLIPCDIVVSGLHVTWQGTMSKKVFDVANAENLISHHITGANGVFCTSLNAATRLAQLLKENSNYARLGA